MASSIAFSAHYGRLHLEPPHLLFKTFLSQLCSLLLPRALHNIFLGFQPVSLVVKPPTRQVSMRHRQVSDYSSTDDSDPSNIGSCFDTDTTDGNRRRNVRFSNRWAPHWILSSLSSTRR